MNTTDIKRIVKSAVGVRYANMEGFLDNIVSSAKAIKFVNTIEADHSALIVVVFLFWLD